MISGYHWCHVRNYAISLSRSCFKGRKVAFAHNCNDDALRGLKLLGFEIIPFDKSGELTVQRHWLFAEWLQQNRDTRFAMLLDARDLVVQTDPAIWLAANVSDDALLFAASECLPIGKEPTNGKWIRELYDDAILTELGGEDVVCAGSLIGEAEAAKELALAIWQECQKRPAWGSDQAALNHLVRTPKFSAVTRIPKMSEGLILTCSWIANARENMSKFRPNLTDEEPDFCGGYSFPRGAIEPFAIVHQYDRDPVKQSGISARLQ